MIGSATKAVSAQPVRDAVRGLHPGSFALVMGTGIVSIAMQGHGLDVLSVLLLWLAGLGYGGLVILHGWRLLAFPGDIAADLTDPARGFGFLTFVAATDVLGTRLVPDAHHVPALALLATGGIAWLVLGYVVPWTAARARATLPFGPAAKGSWFMWVVASQSVAVLAAALEPAVSEGRRELALLAVVSWSVGVVLYAATGVFVAARLLIHPMRPADLAPPYWVAMGATAITVVAGARIMQMAEAPAAATAHRLVAGVSVVFWSFGTWLVPALVAAGIWRHVVHRIPLRYEAILWSIVFPIGMYGVGGDDLGVADHLPIIKDIGDADAWVALAAWTVTFLAMLHHLYHTLGYGQSMAASPSTATPK